MAEDKARVKTNRFVDRKYLEDCWVWLSRPGKVLNPGEDLDRPTWQLYEVSTEQPWIWKQVYWTERSSLAASPRRICTLEATDLPV